MRRSGLLLLVLAVGCGGGGGGNGVAAANAAAMLSGTKASLDGRLFGAAIGRSPQSSFFDPYLQLWVVDRSGGTGSDIRFFVDEEETEAAGFLTKTAERWEYSVTKGPLKGSYGLRRFSEGVQTTQLQLADGASLNSRKEGDVETGAYAPASGREVSFDLRPGRGSWSDGGSQWTLETPEQGAGSGRWEGSDPRLPADLNLDRYGYGTITWRDGTVLYVEAWVPQTSESRVTMHSNGGEAKR